MTIQDDSKRKGRGVTMAAVGRLAGVSQVTVSRALSDPSKVSPETLRRIREAIEVTGYVPNAVAGALASRRSRLVTALVPSITNIVYSSMVQTFTGELRDHDYQILMSETGFDPKVEEAAIAAHLSRRPDAILLTGIHHTAQARRTLLAAGIPVVELWDITDTPIDLCVGFSHVELGRAVAEFCLAAGYRHAATVSAGDERALRRKEGFVRTFQRQAPGPIPDVTFGDQASLARGREALARLVGEIDFAGGVIACSSDLLAHGIMIEALVRGYSDPRRHRRGRLRRSGLWRPSGAESDHRPGRPAGAGADRGAGDPCPDRGRRRPPRGDRSGLRDGAQGVRLTLRGDWGRGRGVRSRGLVASSSSISVATCAISASGSFGPRPRYRSELSSGGRSRSRITVSGMQIIRFDRGTSPIPKPSLISAMMVWLCATENSVSGLTPRPFRKPCTTS